MNLYLCPLSKYLLDLGSKYELRIWLPPYQNSDSKLRDIFLNQPKINNEVPFFPYRCRIAYFCIIWIYLQGGVHIIILNRIFNQSKYATSSQNIG